MRSTRQLSITLPHEMADQLRARVRSGEYASESEVVRESLRALQARERALEDWLRGPVQASYDAMTKDRSRLRSSEEVRASLQAEHRQRKKRQM